MRFRFQTSYAAGSDGASVARSLREACVHWSDAHGEKDSLPSGVAGAQIRNEIPSAFVAQSLLLAGPLPRLARRHARWFKMEG